MNQTETLPVVTIRHPITWLYALCQYRYSLIWKHNPELCDFELHLKHGDVRAKFGYKHLDYKSLIDVWRDWYFEYYEERHYPLLMVYVRHTHTLSLSLSLFLSHTDTCLLTLLLYFSTSLFIH